MRVYVHHLRSARYCMKGSKSFFEKKGLDFRKFLKEGIEIETLEETKDPMALHITEGVRDGRWR